MGEAQAEVIPEVKQWIKDSDELLERIEETERQLETSEAGTVSAALILLVHHSGCSREDSGVLWGNSFHLVPRRRCRDPGCIQRIYVMAEQGSFSRRLLSVCVVSLENKHSPLVCVESFF